MLHIAVSHKLGGESEGNIPEREVVMLTVMLMEWRLSAHIDTNFIVNLTSSSESHGTRIFVKWMPFGRSNNRRVMVRTPSNSVSTLRVPLSLGEVGGAFHRPPACPGPTESSVRSSRRGKEQMRPKISESGREMKDR